MAERRMFAKKITESDSFLDMPSSSQALYFHLNMSADDDGFVNNPKRIQRTVGAAEDDLKLLIAKRFIIIFQSGIIVIKHWKMHNYIQKDRYRPTDYLDEKEMLELKENKAYTLSPDCVDTKCIQTVRVGKESIGKESIGKEKHIVEMAKRIIDDLNAKTKKNYKHTTNTTLSKIKARIKEGFREDDFYIVNEKKVNQWINDPEYCKYLRPETLYGNKFDGYLNQTTIPTNISERTIKNANVMKRFLDRRS